MRSEGLKIVVVEDDSSMSQAIERILRAGGYSPIVFASAEAAIETGGTLAADCLILDIRLPGMSGFELYRRLVADGQKPRTIFITGHDDPSVRDEAEKLGAWRYHPKPFSGRTLLDGVKKAIRSIDL